MQVSAQTTTAMSAAATPEEAYKIFAGAVSKGLGDLVADALGKALGAASVAAANPNIAGWEQYVQGIGMSMVWGTPGYKTPPTVLASFSNAIISAPAKPTLLGGSITVGGTWTF